MPERKFWQWPVLLASSLNAMPTHLRIRNLDMADQTDNPPQPSATPTPPSATQPMQPPAAPLKAAQTGQSGANSASVAPEPPSSATTTAPAPRTVEPPAPPQEPAKRPRRRKVRRDRQHRVKAQRKRKPGRPTVFEKVFCEQGRKLVEAGFTDGFLAYFFSVSGVTFYQWQKRYPTFKKALDRGRKYAVAEAKKEEAEAAKAWQNDRRFL